MPEADRIDIVIASNADEAARAISNLAAQMSKLSRATTVASKNTAKIGKVAKDVETATHDASEETQEAESKISSFGKKLSGISIPFNKFSKVVGGLARATGIVNKSMAAMPRYFGGRLITRVKDATKSMSSFFGSIKRIALYRGIRTALKLITQGFSQGIANMYNWSKTSDGVFAASMDRLASSSQYLSNSLGAMAAPLLNSLAPAIEYIIDRIVALINMINMLFAILSGSGTYTVATKTAAGWGKAAKGAGGAAKEVKKTLLACDELNKLTDNSGGGGGGGGGGAGGLNFEQRTVNEWLKNAIETGNWFAIGQAIANKINETLDAINWDQIKKKAVGFARGIANLINGFIADIDPKIVGKTIGEVINTGASFISTFWGETNWEGLGSVLKQTIIKAINTIDGKTLASALMGPINAAVNFLKGLLPETYEEWKLVVGSLIGWLKLAIHEFPKDSIAQVISSLINGALALITELVNGGTLTDLISAIATTIKQAIEGVDKQALWDAFEAVLKAIFTFAVAAIDLTFKIGSVNPAAGAILGGIILFRSGLMKLFGNFLFKSIFSSVKLGSLVKGAAVVVGIAIGINGLMELNDVLQSNEGLSANEFSERLLSALGKLVTAAGFILFSFNPAAGAIVVGVGIIIRLLPQLEEAIDNASEWTTEHMGAGVAAQLRGMGFYEEAEAYEQSLKGLNDTSKVPPALQEIGTGLANGLDKGVFYNTPDLFGGSGSVTNVTNNYYYNNAGATLTPTSTTKNPTNGQTIHYTSQSLFTAADSEVTVTLKKGWSGSVGKALGIPKEQFIGVSLTKGSNPTATINVTKKQVSINTGGGGHSPGQTIYLPEALGGAFYGNFWHSIPQYAGGTLNAYGSLFLAGEAGPELVGHVGGRTEVLNKSQLASAMFSAVRSAMAPVAIGFASAAASLRGYNEEDMAEMLDLVRTGNEARQAQNAILREQTQYLREINDKDFATDITTAAINRAQARTNRRAGATVSSVGF